MRKFRGVAGKPNHERRKDAPAPEMCIIFMDIDNFKKINDAYGHHAGDNVLKRVAETLREAVRTTDITGRWGGEEFIVALPGTKLEDASLVAEKIRRTIEKLRVTSHAHKIPVTVSIGVCKYDWQRHKDLFALVHDADQAMYEAKQSGKNRVVVASA
jgi:diguanylate cyclase (GGDEF)-like protein